MSSSDRRMHCCWKSKHRGDQGIFSLADSCQLVELQTVYASWLSWPISYTVSHMPAATTEKSEYKFRQWMPVAIAVFMNVRMREKKKETLLMKWFLIMIVSVPLGIIQGLHSISKKSLMDNEVIFYICGRCWNAMICLVCPCNVWMMMSLQLMVVLGCLWSSNANALFMMSIHVAAEKVQTNRVKNEIGMLSASIQEHRESLIEVAKIAALKQEKDHIEAHEESMLSQINALWDTKRNLVIRLASKEVVCNERV